MEKENSRENSRGSIFSADIPRRPSIKFSTPKDLLMSVNAVVKNRSGSVLARQMILKNDHFDTPDNPKLDIHLQGAPNFRMADMNIFGTAQPTVPGIKTILTLLHCNPESYFLVFDW